MMLLAKQIARELSQWTGGFITFATRIYNWTFLKAE